MKGFVPPDPLTKVSTLQFAVVYMPKRSRKRFSANCVEIKETEEIALADAKPKEFYFAARVLGPSKSTEGHFIYYLDHWIR